MAKMEWKWQKHNLGENFNSKQTNKKNSKHTENKQLNQSKKYLN